MPGRMAAASSSLRRWTGALCGAAFLLLGTGAALAQNGRLNPPQRVTYDNRFEVYTGASFMNFQAGQNLPKRMNLGGPEVMATYWLGDHLGVAADYRFEVGTTPVFPVPGFHRVTVYQQIFMGGVQYRGPKGRYAAIDYHALAGASHGTFDSSLKNYPGATPYTASDLGLYTNRTKPFYALGGSVDFNYKKNIGIRLQPDLILEHYGTELREFVAVSGGVVFRLGHR